MKTALVAIPTTGKREDILDVMKNVRNSLEKINVRPVFSICADDTTIITNKSFKDTICFSLRTEKFDYTHHIMEAIKHGIEEFNPDFVSLIPDDFIIPAKKFGNLIKPLTSGSDVTIGFWGSNKIASSYPRFQYVSELFVSRIANAASTVNQATDYKKLMSYTFDYKTDFLGLVQLFTGLFAFKTDKWKSVSKKIDEIFHSAKLGWSLEILIFLLAADMKMKIKNMSCNRVKEKNDPVMGERDTRLVQMEDAFMCTNKFVEFTKQYEKLNKLPGIQSKMIKIVENLLTESGI